MEIIRESKSRKVPREDGWLYNFIIIFQKITIIRNVVKPFSKVANTDQLCSTREEMNPKKLVGT